MALLQHTPDRHRRGAAALPRARLRLPCHSFKNHDEFQQFCKNDKTLIDNRRIHEQSLATQADSIAIDGTCGLCLRPARFLAQTAYGEAVNGGRLPDWREELSCDCEYRLASRERALLHFLRSHNAMTHWMRLLAFGDIGMLLPPLSAEVAEVVTVARLHAGPPGAGPHLPVANAQCHMAVSLDTLHRVPPLQAAFAEIARAVVPGGRFVFTVPFQADIAKTTSSLAALQAKQDTLPVESPDPVHHIGWDVLDMLREAGFVDSTAFLYWSEELGYMGGRNFIFSASK